MFQRRIANRRRTPPTSRSRPGSGLARRLGVESMEGRVMLSATMLEFAPLDLQAAQIGLETAPGTFAGDQTASLATIREGGFVTNGFSLSDGAADGNVLQPVGAAATGALDYIISRNTNAAPAAIGAGDTWQLFDADGAAGNSIQPITFVDVDGNSELQPTIDQGLTEYSEIETTADEGGPIPIQTILSRNEPDIGIKSRAGALAKSAFDAPISSEPLNRLASIAASSTAATKDEQISGDWARAMVFEMAGGEPDDNRRPAASDQEDLPVDDASSRRADGPLSAIEMERGAKQGGAEQNLDRAAVRAGGEMLAGESGDVVGADLARLDLGIGGEVSGENIGASVLNRSTSVVVGAPSNRAVVGGGNLSGPDEAYIAAFDELGDSERSVLTTLADGALRGSFGATPLLMVLALERIAANNSRRAKNGASVAETRWPRRSRVAASDGGRA